MNFIQKITTIRDRGQMTVPYEIRKVLNWPENELMVKIETTVNGFTVEPLAISHPQNVKKKLSEKEWNKVFNEMEKISTMGKKGVNLTNFLRKDRDSRI